MTVPITPEWFPRDKVCIVGHGQTEYTPWGQITRPEFQLALEAIIAAVADAGLDMKDIDGFASYADDRSDPARLATYLGIPHLRYANMHWGGGGGGGSGSIMNALLAVASGSANYVVCYRSLAQGQFGRFGQGRAAAGTRLTDSAAFSTPWGISNAAQRYALQARRHMSLYGTQSKHFSMISVACYKHASRNPAAVQYPHTDVPSALKGFAHGPLTLEEAENARIIADPIRLFHCCLENDGSAAIVVTSAERARDLKWPPVYIMAANQGSGFRQEAGAYNKADFDTANFEKTADDLWAKAGIGPKDIDVAQVYENMTPMTLMSIENHGFCKKGEGGSFVEDGRIEWPNGDLPINTSGGNIAECYMHGFELNIEATRQMRGTSTCQVKDAETCLVASGPGVSPVTDMVVRR